MNQFGCVTTLPLQWDTYVLEIGMVGITMVICVNVGFSTSVL